MPFIEDLSAAVLTHGIKEGQWSAREVATAALEATNQREEDIHAFVQITPELLFAQADRIDAKRAAGETLGALAGVPVAFKDNMNLEQTKTTCASRMLETYESPFTATCVARLLEADALPLGKLNMDEFAFGSSTETSAQGRTYNPWDTTRVPGGSSGGSAAAVAAGEAVITLGSDTGGSIRQPASLCGVVGMKPTYGAVSRYGVVAFGSSLDQVGPMARRVEDVAAAMDALVSGGKDPYDATSQEVDPSFVAALDASIAGKKVGVVSSLLELDAVTDEMKACFAQACEALVEAGAELVEVNLPHMTSAIAAYYVIAPCEAFSNLARFDGVRYGYQEEQCSNLFEQTARSRAHGFGKEAIRRQMLGAYLLSSGVYDTYYYAAQKVRTLITQDYHEAFERCDVLLLPTSPRTAFKFGEISDPLQMYASDMFTISNNIAGNGGISVPFGRGTDSGLPVSVQLQAPAFEDHRLITFAAALERAAGSLGVAPGYAHRGGEL